VLLFVSKISNYFERKTAIKLHEEVGNNRLGLCFLIAAALISPLSFAQLLTVLSLLSLDLRQQSLKNAFYKQAGFQLPKPAIETTLVVSCFSFAIVLNYFFQWSHANQTGYPKLFITNYYMTCFLALLFSYGFCSTFEFLGNLLLIFSGLYGSFSFWFPCLSL